MKYIVFKTGNPHESMFAAAMCSGDVVKGISINYEGLKRTSDGKFELDFKAIVSKMKSAAKTQNADDSVEELKTEGSKLNEKADEYFVFPNIVAKNTEGVTVTVIDDLMVALNSAMVSPQVSPYVIELLKVADTVFLGAQDDREVLPEEHLNDPNQVFVTYTNMLKDTLAAKDNLNRYLCMGIGKVNLIKKLVDLYPSVTLGEYTFYKSYEFIPYAINRDLEVGKKVAVYRDNTGESKGEKPSFILFIFADTVPTEFAGLEFTETFDPMVGKKCKVATVPMVFWANAMSHALK